MESTLSKFKVKGEIPGIYPSLTVLWTNKECLLVCSIAALYQPSWRKQCILDNASIVSMSIHGTIGGVIAIIIINNCSTLQHIVGTATFMLWSGVGSGGKLRIREFSHVALSIV